MKLVQLIYCSQVTGRLTLDSVQCILNTAAHQNPPRGITGFLAFNDRNFLQVIEGGPSAVNQLYGSICRDPRHHGLHLISFREMTERQFPHFAMGDCDLTAVDSSTIERFADSTVFEPNQFSMDAALRLLQSLETRRRQEMATHAL